MTAKITWYPLGGASDAYPQVIGKLKKSSGVYAIRHRGWLSKTVVYVGESHSGNLYKTLVRHFQAWNRGKGWWTGQYAPAQTDPGHTYDRASHEVAFRVASPARALALQAAWIASLKPRDNVIIPEKVPF